MTPQGAGISDAVYNAMLSGTAGPGPKTMEAANATIAVPNAVSMRYAR